MGPVMSWSQSILTTFYKAIEYDFDYLQNKVLVKTEDKKYYLPALVRTWLYSTFHNYCKFTTPLFPDVVNGKKGSRDDK